MNAHRFLAASLILLGACGDDDGALDAATDGALDAAEDTSFDVSTDVASDVSTDASDGAIDVAPDGEPDAGPEMRSAFALTGHLARVMLTCDGGETWVWNRSSDDDARCWDMLGGSGPECDHHVESNNGVAFGEGKVLFTLGWGEDPAGEHGLFEFDPLSGEHTRVQAGTFNGIDYGAGMWISGSREACVASGDLSFRCLEPFHYRPVRHAFFADLESGPLYGIVADDFEIVVTGDGENFHRDSGSCDAGSISRGIGGGETVLIYSSRDDRGCRSNDRGETWMPFSFGVDLASNLVWDGEAFVGWTADNQRVRSADGTLWAGEPLETPGVQFQHVARSADGTLLGVTSIWAQYYEGARLYRSNDGLSWEQPSGAAAVNGHPIRAIASGMVPAAACASR